jgi:hypothetical protein
VWRRVSSDDVNVRARKKVAFVTFASDDHSLPPTKKRRYTPPLPPNTYLKTRRYTTAVAHLTIIAATI